MRLLMGLVMLPLWFCGVALAHPTMDLPEVSLGESPYRVFSSSVEDGSTVDVFTVPAGQDFIATTFWFPHEYCGLLRDGAVVIEGSLLAGNLVKKGVSRFRFEEGSTISVQVAAGYSVDFSIHGYLVRAGSPYRFVYGNSGTGVGTTKTIFATDADRSFIVRSLVLGIAGCDINVGELSFEWSGSLFHYSFTKSAYSSHQGTLVIPPDSSLQITVQGTGLGCDYLMSGEYITP